MEHFAFGPKATDDPKWDEAGRVHDWRNYISSAKRGERSECGLWN